MKTQLNRAARPAGFVTLKDRYRWNDLNANRKKPVVTANPITAPGWTDAANQDNINQDRGSQDRGSLGVTPEANQGSQSPDNPSPEAGTANSGISPGTAGMIGQGLGLMGRATGNESMSAIGGLLGIAGSSNPAASFAGAGASMVAGSMFGARAAGPIGGIVSGAITGGLPGAITGGLTGLVAMNPVGMALMALDGFLNDGKVLGSIRNGITDLVEGQPWGTASSNLAIGAPAVSPTEATAQAAMNSTNMAGVPAGTTPASSGLISSGVTAVVDPAQAAQKAAEPAVAPTATAAPTVEAAPAPTVAPEPIAVAPDVTFGSFTMPTRSGGLFGGSNTNTSDNPLGGDVTAAPEAAPTADIALDALAPGSGWGGDYGGSDRGNDGGGYGTGGNDGGYGPQ